MPLPRVLEPEVMDTEEEARDYDSMDHAEVNARFCEDFLALGSGLGAVLDAGTGTALIPIELCRRAPATRVRAIDLAASMLGLARRNVARAGMEACVLVESKDARDTGFATGMFDAAISNSLAHHLAEPERLLAELVRVTRPGGVIFVRDLFRPSDTNEVRRLVEAYASIPPGLEPSVAAAAARQQGLFEASLRAALTVEEVAARAARLDIPAAAIRATSDRHWTLAWKKPPR